MAQSDKEEKIDEIYKEAEKKLQLIAKRQKEEIDAYLAELKEEKLKKLEQELKSQPYQLLTPSTMEKKTPTTPNPDEKIKIMTSDERKELRKKIKEAKTPEELEAIDAEGTGLESVYEDKMKKLRKGAEKIKTDGEDGKKKIKKAGGDPAKIEPATKKAAAEAEATTEEASEEMKEVIEGEGSSLESETHTSPEIHASRKAAEEAELGKAGTPAADPEKTAPKAPPPTAEQIQKTEATLVATRDNYFKVYKEFAEEKKKTNSWFKNMKQKYFGGEIKAEEIEESNSELAQKLRDAKAAYNAALVEKGNSLVAQEKAKEEIYKTLILDEKQARIDAEVALVPEKVAGLVEEGLARYMAMGPIKRQIITTAVFTGVMWGFGGLAGAGVLGYAGSRVARGIAGQLAVSARHKWWGSQEKDLKKLEEEFKTKQTTQEFGSTPMSMAVLENMQQAHNEKLLAEKNIRIKNMIKDGLTRILAGGAVLGVEHGVGAILHHGDNIPVDDHGVHPDDGNHPVPPPTPTPKPTYEIREIKVDYSSRGAIDTWANVKSALRGAYSKEIAEGHLEKIPPEYRHILDTRADSLAKEFGGWKPGEANESLNMLKGSYLEFDKDGHIMSHSIRGGTESLGNADGTGIHGETGEKYFHYEKPVPQPDTPPDVGDPDNPPMPDQPTGIGDPNNPPIPLDKNGFWGGNGHGQHFESHVSHPADAGDNTPEGGDHEAWDGKHHTKLWWKRHPDGMHTRHWLKNHPDDWWKGNSGHAAEKLAQQAPYSQTPWQQPYYDAGRDIDRAFAQTAENSGGTVSYQPIMNPGNPSGAPISFQHIEQYGPKLNSEQVARILNGPTRFVSQEYLDRLAKAGDAGLPLYKVIHDLEAHGYAPNPGEKVYQFLARVRIASQADASGYAGSYFSHMQNNFPNTWQWFKNNNFWQSNTRFSAAGFARGAFLFML